MTLSLCFLEHYYIINKYEEAFIYAQPGDDVTLACSGTNGILRIGGDTYHDNTVR